MRWWGALEDWEPFWTDHIASTITELLWYEYEYHISTVGSSREGTTFCHRTISHERPACEVVGMKRRHVYAVSRHHGIKKPELACGLLSPWHSPAQPLLLLQFTSTTRWHLPRQNGGLVRWWSDDKPAGEDVSCWEVETAPLVCVLFFKWQVLHY